MGNIRKKLHNFLNRKNGDFKDKEFLRNKDQKQINELKEEKVEIRQETKETLAEIDKEIARIQRSTKTTIPAFSPLHNRLRSKYRWYYNWHLLPHIDLVHIGLLLIYTATIILAVLNATVSGTPKITKAGTLATITWSGAGDGSSWNDSANWGGTVPNSSSYKAVIASGSANISTPTSALTLGSLELSSGYTGTLSLGANLTLSSAYDSTAGNLMIGSGATLNTSSSNYSITLSGSWSNSGTFTANSSTVTLNATSTGKTLSGTMTGTSSFNNVTLNGSGGQWTLSYPVTLNGNLTVTAGTLLGKYDMTVKGGAATGDGTINLTGGTFQLSGTGNFGGNTNWTFDSLYFGDGSTSGTTSKTGSGNIKTTAKMKVQASQTLNAGSSTWQVDGDGFGYLSSVKQVSAGYYHTCAVKTDGTLYCWGDNSHGQLGDNSTTQRNTPVQVLGVGGSGNLTSVASVSTGEYYTCAIKTDGTLYCWGYNTSGQLGDNTTTNRLTPIQVLGVGGSGSLTGVASVSANSSHTCAVKTDNTLYCWGFNYFSQLGDNSTTQRNTPIQVLGVGGSGNLTNVASVSAGGTHTCAVKTDNTLYCWGNNGNGQLGDNTTTQRNTPVQVLGVGGSGNLTNVASVSAGGSHTCAVKTDNTLYCWGDNYSGQLGDNSTTQRNTPVQVLGVGGSGNLTSVTSVSAGSSHTCARKTDNTLYCWGSNYFSQLGDNSTTQRNTPVQVLGVGGSGNLTSVTSIFAGGSHTCALKTDGTLYCWGANYYGQLGDNSTTQRNTPVQVLGVGGSGNLTGVTSISAGNAHTCAIKTNGTLYCWGANYYGQLGDNSTTQRNAPVQVLGVGGSGNLTSVASVSAGNSHTCAVQTDGTLYCWGNNGGGQLGDNTTTQRNTPVQVLGVGGSGNLTSVASVSAGESHTCAIKTDNTLYCWGYNSNGQLGDNSTTQRNTPVQVLGVGGSGSLTGVASVSSGYSHTCALKTDGTLHCWGNNGSGQVGDNTTTQRNTPVQVLGVGGSGNLTNVASVAAGNAYTCAVKTDGTVYCWGDNSSGQLGDNTTTQKKTPVQVLGVGGSGNLTNVASVSAGGSHTCAVKTDNTLYCWGDNHGGQLGDNSTTQRNTPVQVLGVGGSGNLTSVTSIFAGGSHTCARKTDNTLYCWGYSYVGQLGYNTTTQQNTPVQTVAFLGLPLITSGTFNAQTSTFNFTANNDPGTTAGKSLTYIQIPSATFNQLQLNKSGKHFLLAGNTTTNDLTITAGDLSFLNSSLTLSIAGNYSNSDTLDNSLATVAFTKSSGTQTLNSGGIGLGKSFQNLTHSGAGTLQVITSSLDINGTFTQSSGTLDLATGNQNISIAGNVNISGGSVTKGSGTVTLDGDLTYSAIAGINLGNLTIGHSPDTTTLSSDLTADSVTIDTGDSLITQGYDISSNGNITIGSGATLNATHDDSKGGATLITLSGNWSNSGTFTADTSVVTFNATSSGKTVSGTLNGSSSFYKVAFNGSGGAWTITDSMVVTADATDTFVIGNGTVTLGDSTGDNLEVRGRLSVTTTAGQTGTFQTYSSLTPSQSIIIDINQNNSGTPPTCTNCSIYVGYNGNGTFKISKNVTLRLNPDSTAQNNIPVNVYSTGYLEIQGSQDATGTSTGTTNETTLTDSTKSWTTNEHVGKTVRMTSGLAFGKLYSITANDATSLTRASTASADAVMTVTGSGTTRKICSDATSLITTNNGEVGRYLYDKTGTTDFFKIIDSTNDDATCTGTKDSFLVVAEPANNFTPLTNNDTFAITDAVKQNDTYEILNYANVTAEAGTACTAAVNESGKGEAYIYNVGGSETLIRYADVCNLGTNRVWYQTGVTFYQVNGANSGEGFIVDKSKIHKNLVGIFPALSKNSGLFNAKGITNNAIYDNTDTGISASSQGNNTNIDISYNNVFNNTYGINANNNNSMTVSHNIAYGHNSLGTSTGIYGSSNSLIYSNTVYNNSHGIGYASNARIFNNDAFGNTTDGFFVQQGVNNFYYNNNSYANAYGISYNSTTAPSYAFEEKYGTKAPNTTTDVGAGNGRMVLYNSKLDSTSEITSNYQSGQYVISFKNDQINGKALMGGYYTVPSASSETPQSEETLKFNYSDNSWENSFSPHVFTTGYTVSGSEDTNLDYGISGSAGGDSNVYIYHILCTAANCVTSSNSWLVYRNGIALTNLASTGSTYTDTQNDGASAPNIQFKIDDLGTDYTAGAAYDFVFYKASNDQNSQKVVTHNFTAGSGSNDVTIPSGSEMQFNGSATYPSTWSSVDSTRPFNIANNGTISGGYNTLTVNGTISGSGIFSMTNGSTVENRINAAKNFGSTSGSNGWTFNNLTFSNFSTGTNYTVTTTTGGTGAIIVNGSLNIGIVSDTKNTTLDNETNDRIINANDVSITSKGLLSASSTADFTLSGSWSNSGTFTANSGTVILDGSNASTVSGTTTFNNFTCTTAGKTIAFQHQTSNSPIFTFSGTFTLTGTSGNNINLQSDSSGAQWLPHFNSAQTTVTYANIKDSGGDTGTATVSNLSTSTNVSGNNTSVWLFTDGVFGSLYDGIGGSKITSTKTIKASVNGGVAISTSSSNGDYAIDLGVTLAANSIITVFVSGDSVKASTITKVSGGGSLTGVDIFKNYTTIRHEGSITSLTNTDLDTADNVSDSDLLTTISSGNATFTQGVNIVPSKTYAPGANVTIGGSFNNSGIYTASTNTTTFNATSSGKVLAGNLDDTSSFYKVAFNGTGGAWTITDSMVVTADATDTFVIGNGTVTLGDSTNDNLEVRGKMSVSTTANQTGTFQTYSSLTPSQSIIIDINQNNSGTPPACTNCGITVGATSGTGQGNFKISKNVTLRLNPDSTAATDLGFTTQSTGYTEIQGSQDATGMSLGTTNETTIADTVQSWTTNEHVGKTVRMTSGLAFGKLYPITANDATSLTRADTSSIDSTIASFTTTGPVTKVCSASTSMITANDQEIGRYLHNKTGTDGYLKIVDSVNDDSTCSSNDSFLVIAEPDAFSILANGNTIDASDAIKQNDTYEILNYANVTAEAGTACTATVNETGKGEAYYYGQSSSENVFRYANVCNLGRNASNKTGLYFTGVDGSQANQGVIINKSNIKSNYLAIGMHSSSKSNNANNSKGITSNSIHDSISYGFHFDGSSNNNLISSNRIYNNTYGLYLQDCILEVITSNIIYGHSSNGIYGWTQLRFSTISSNAIYSNAYGIALSNTSPSNIISSNAAFANSINISVVLSNNNIISSNKIYSASSSGLDLSSSNKSSIFSNTIYNNSNGIKINSATNNNFFSNNVYSNAIGLYAYFDPTSANYSINDNFGGLGNNTTSDINYWSATVHKLALYNTSLNSSTKIGGGFAAGSYIASKKDAGSSGTTKIWGQYTAPSAVAETPQSEETDKFDYASNSWEKSVSPHGYSGTGTEDTNLSYDVSSADLSSGPYVYRLTAKTAGSGASCGTSQAVFDVYRNETDVGDATSGTQFTDANGSVNLKFTIDCGSTAYAVGDTYTFAAWDASNDTNTTKTVTSQRNGDKITIPAGSTMSFDGGSSNHSTLSPSSATNLLDLQVDGTLSGGNNDLTVNGNVTGSGVINLGSGSSFTHKVGAASKTFGSTSGSNDWTFGNLTFRNGSTSNQTITTNTGGTGKIVSNGATLYIGDPSDTNTTTLDNETNDRIINANDVSITSKGLLSASSTADFTLSGNWSNSGILTANSGTITFTKSSGTQTLDSGGIGKPFYNLTHSGAGTLQLITNDLKITNNLTNSAGTFDVNGKNINIAQDWNNTAIVSNNTGTVTFDGINKNGTIHSNGSSFNDVKMQTPLYQSITSGLVGYWKLDEGANTTANDSSGNNYSGTLTNGPTWTSSVKNSNYYGGDPYGAIFDGSDDMIFIPDNSVLDPSVFSVAFWIKYSTTANKVIVEKNSNSGYSFQAYLGKISMWVGGESRGSVTSSTSNDNTWHHIVGIFTGAGTGGSKIYVDGSMASTESSPPNTPNYGSSTPMYVGSRNGSFGFPGSIDDVRVYNRALTTDEISSIYNGETFASNTTYTLDDNLTATGNLDIYTNTTLDANGKNITLSGNWSNSGTFTANSGTVTINGSGTSTIAGTTTFNNFTCTTAGKTIAFQHQTSNSPIFTFSGTFTLTGTSGNNINLQSDSSGTQWLPHFNSAQTTVTYANIKDSGGDTGTATVSNLSTSTNVSGNNMGVWLFNQAPTNDSLTFTNPYSGTADTVVSDDTTQWNFQAKITDADGASDISSVDLRFANSSDSSTPYDSLKFHWDRATDTFSEAADTQDSATLTSSSSDSSAAGNQWTLDFKVKFNNNFLAKDTAYAIELFSIDSVSQTDLDNYANIYKVTNLSLTLAVDSNSLAFGSLLPGTVVTGTTTTTVNTNYTNGYSLSINDGSDTNSALVHGDLATHVADYSGTIALPTSWSDTGLGICVYQATNKDTDKWGTGTTENDSSNKYAGVPQNATVINIKNASPTVDDLTKIGYKMVLPNTQKTGAYSGTVTFTATGVLN